MPKAWSSALVSLLNSAVNDDVIATPGVPFVTWDLYTITTPAGLTLLYTTANFPISAPSTAIFTAPAVYGGVAGNVWFSGMVWQPFGIDSTRKKATGHWKVGLDSDQWQVQISPRPFDLITLAPYPDTIGGVPWLQAAKNGALDSADVIISRAYFSAVPSYDPSSASWIGPYGNGIAPVGTGIIFRGTIGPIDISTTSALITINDYKQILTQQMPRNLYMASCRNRFGDTRCTVNLATYTQTGTASAASTSGQIVATAPLPNPGGSGTFALGVVTMTSGANNGLMQTVNGWDGAATLNLLRPFPYAIAPGDTFSVYAGCDKSQGACAQFSNSANYRADPFVPAPEVTLG